MPTVYFQALGLYNKYCIDVNSLRLELFMQYKTLPYFL
jgi:hypothetical protein